MLNVKIQCSIHLHFQIKDVFSNCQIYRDKRMLDSLSVSIHTVSGLLQQLNDVLMQDYTIVMVQGKISMCGRNLGWREGSLRTYGTISSNNKTNKILKMHDTITWSKKINISLFPLIAQISKRQEDRTILMKSVSYFVENKSFVL